MRRAPERAGFWSYVERPCQPPRLLRMTRPLIGITAYAEPEVRWGVWTSPAALIPLNYVEAIEAAGGRPLLVPPSREAIDETLDALDGLLLSGGSDLDPDLYGAEPHPETNGVRPERDA